MNLDFRKLTLTEAAQAINNTLKQDDATFLAYLIQQQDFDVWGWFNIDKSSEGLEYWVAIKERINNEKITIKL